MYRTKQPIRLNESQLRQIVNESVKRILKEDNPNDLMMTNDGGYITNDGYSLDGMEDAEYERRYMEDMWEGMPEDIDYPKELDGDTPLEIILSAAEMEAKRNGRGFNYYEERDNPWAYAHGIEYFYHNKKYNHLVKPFGNYLLNKYGLAKVNEENDINSVSDMYRAAREDVQNLMKKF